MFAPEDFARIFPDLAGRGHSPPGLADQTRLDDLEQMLRGDALVYLPQDILTKVDRASMAHSLEVREPLMDHKLIEWLATLPSTHKIRGQEGKYLLKKAMESHLPNDVLYRPKMGFAVPLARWFRGPLKGRVREAILGSTLAETGIFNRDYLQHLVDAHQSGAKDYSASLWTVMMFEAFLRNVMEAGEAA
jgi:asparagine synthase (glutamine-hydrolysing)